MRLDLFLKWSRLIPRRSVAKETCDAGRVSVNGHPARAGRELNPGDLIALELPRRILRVRLLDIPLRPPSKDQSRHLFEVLEDRRVNDD